MAADVAKVDVSLTLTLPRVLCANSTNRLVRMKKHPPQGEGNNPSTQPGTQVPIVRHRLHLWRSKEDREALHPLLSHKVQRGLPSFPLPPPIIRLSVDVDRDSEGNGHAPRRQSAESIRTGPVIDDYANLQGESLLKKTLGYTVTLCTPVVS